MSRRLLWVGVSTAVVAAVAAWWMAMPDSASEIVPTHAMSDRPPSQMGGLPVAPIRSSGPLAEKAKALKSSGGQGKEVVERIEAVMRAGASESACADVQPDLKSVLTMRPENSELSLWVVKRVAQCIDWMPPDARAGLLAISPSNGQLLLAEARSDLLRGRPADAIARLEQGDLQDWEALDLLGSANLWLARRAGEEKETSSAHLQRAADALTRAISLAGDQVDPWTLERMAEVQLQLGNAPGALSWADRAIQKARSAGDEGAALYKIAALNMNVGIIYFRTGQTGTGIAYMDQALTLASSEEERAHFSEMKRATTGGA